MQTTGEEPQELEERAWACLGSGALASRAHQGASEPLEVTALWSLRGARRMGFQFQPPSAWRPPQLHTSHRSKPASGGLGGSPGWLPKRLNTH